MIGLLIKLKTYLNRAFFKAGPFVFKLLYALNKKDLQAAVSKGKIKKILVMRTYYIGDNVVFLPTLYSLRNVFPKARIDFMTSKQGKEIANEENVVDGIIECSFLKFLRKTRLEKLKFIWSIRKNKYDLVISSTGDYEGWFSVLAFFSGAPFRVGFKHLEGYFLYNTQIELDESKTEVERNLDIVRALGKPLSHRLPSVHVKDESLRHVDELLKEYGVCERNVLIGIHACGYRLSRFWLMERYQELCNKIGSDENVWVIFTGGERDREFLERLCKDIKCHCIILAGKITISQFKALLKRLVVFVTIDTGPMHLSAAVGTNTVALFGPGDFNKWNYNVPHFKSVRKELPCSPCYLYECKGHECMKAIEVNDVLDKVYSFIGQKR